ncbi:hypothetical protein RvY_03748 [Ramazzottius varieornatus]|uniref:DUF659 domain-containing protein n=1 Tax=Ramazzottius varieornatus TaxID=947166 RepID=A0A1D1UP49_RAMVA|nr:hypothetical protein RvY_03748 [Ramazzottius varieornatus]
MNSGGSLEPKKPSYPRNHSKQRLLNLNVARIQVETLICPDILGHSSFDRAIKGADSALKWPKRDTITRRLLPSIYKKLETKALDLLKSATAIAINCDIWSSKRQRGYLGVSAHYIDENFKLQHVFLACPRFSGIHSADQILDLTVEVLTKFEIENKVWYIGTDNGPNIVNAFKDWFPEFIDLHDPNKFDTDMEDVFHRVIYGDEELELEPIDAEDLDTSSPLAEEVAEKLIQRYELMQDRKILVRCVAHTLQLCPKTPVENCKMLNNSVEKLATVVAKLKKSTQGSEYVEKELGMALKALCATQWNSNFMMAERAIKLDWTAAGLDPKHRLSREHQNILEDFVEMTRPFQEAFETLQQNGVPAICQVLPSRIPSGNPRW